MFCSAAGALPAGRYRWSAIVVALCAALIGFAAFGVVQASATGLPGEHPLLYAVTPGSQRGPWMYDTDRNVSWNDNEEERYAVNCLINEVRVKAGLNRVSFAPFIRRTARRPRERPARTTSALPSTSRK